MRKASEYRHHAEECRKLAAKMKTGDQRDHMLKIAKVWDQLARISHGLIGWEAVRLSGLKIR